MSEAWDSGGTAREKERRHHRDLVASLLTGQLAGLTMLAAMMLVEWGRRGDPLIPLRAIGSAFLGDPHMRPGPGVPVLGLFVHQLGFSLLWSLVYAIALRWAARDPMEVTAPWLSERYGPAALGPLVGMAAQLVNVLAVWPFVAHNADWRYLFGSFDGWLFHLVFGGTLALFPLVRRALYGRPAPVAPVA